VGQKSLKKKRAITSKNWGNQNVRELKTPLLEKEKGETARRKKSSGRVPVEALKRGNAYAELKEKNGLV